MQQGNQEGLRHFVVDSWWDKTQKKVQTFVLDDATKEHQKGYLGGDQTFS
jgi:hypothetical protein